MNGTLTPFNVGAGIRSGLSGRIKPTGWQPPEGAYVYCLGYDVPGRFEMMRSGDSVVLSQAAALPAGVILLKVRAFMRGPAVALPGGLSWVLSILIGNTELARRKLLPGRSRDLTDLAVNIQSYASSTVTLKLKLGLEGPGGLFAVELPGIYVDKVDIL